MYRVCSLPVHANGDVDHLPVSKHLVDLIVSPSGKMWYGLQRYTATAVI